MLLALDIGNTTVAAALAASEGIKAAREGKGEVRSLQSYHASISKG